MQFNEFNKKNLSNLRAEIESVLKKYGMDSNLEISVGSMRYSSAEVEVKVKAKVVGGITFSDTILESRIKALNLVKEKNGRKLVEYNTRRWKMPFVYEMDGKRFKCDENYARVYFAA